MGSLNAWSHAAGGGLRLRRLLRRCSGPAGLLSRGRRPHKTIIVRVVTESHKIAGLLNQAGALANVVGVIVPEMLAKSLAPGRQFVAGHDPIKNLQRFANVLAELVRFTLGVHVLIALLIFQRRLQDFQVFTDPPRHGLWRWRSMARGM